MKHRAPLIQYQIDAFADRPFTGNPAAVILTPAALDAGLMQNLAMENNLSETAFLTARAQSGHYDLRWFTPTAEIGFCGHATIAGAHALMTEHAAPLTANGELVFHGKIGALPVRKDAGRYILRAPIAPAAATVVTPQMRAAFPAPIECAFRAEDNLYVVFETPEDIKRYAPDFSAILPLSPRGVGITARAADNRQDYDCVSRFFVPAEGINEDPVTGSAHAAIGPYWARRLGKTSLTAYQASARGGTLRLTLDGDHIDIAGPAVTVMKTEIYLPDAPI